MNILALDTSAAQCSVMLQCGSCQYLREENTSRQHSRHVLSMIDQVLADAKVTLADLDLLVWNAGPGSFTGLRIGASVIQALSYSCRVPVLSLSTLEVLAYQAANLNLASSRIAVAQDARMNGIYWASFVCENGKIRREEADQLLATDLLASRLPALFPERGWIGIGTAWHVLPASAMEGSAGIFDMAAPDSSTFPVVLALLELALQKDPSERILNPADCVPYYINDATQWKKRSLRVPVSGQD